jgi:small subunit ribosomal protein S3
MSHKVHPIGYRLGTNANWSSRWFDLKNFPLKLAQDIAIRALLTKKLRNAGLERVEIERTGNNLSVIIHTSRPGLVIGRSGAGAEMLQRDIERVLGALHEELGAVIPTLRIEAREVRNPESFASLVGLNVAEQIERRMPFRRVLKRAMERIMMNKEVKGARIAIAGRLGGAEMARRERIQEGRLPRNTLRSNIDFSLQEAYTTYGVIGIKVWIYKGQKLD